MIKKQIQNIRTGLEPYNQILVLPYYPKTVNVITFTLYFIYLFILALFALTQARKTYHVMKISSFSN